MVPSLNRIFDPVRGLGALGGTQFVGPFGLAHCWVLRGHPVVLRSWWVVFFGRSGRGLPNASRVWVVVVVSWLGVVVG